MVVVCTFRLSSITTGRKLRTYNRRQLHRHRHAFHRLELAFALPKIVGPQPFNKLLNKQEIIKKS